MPGTILRPITSGDHDMVVRKLIESWGVEIVIVHGQLFHPAELPGIGVFADTVIIGLLTYKIDKESCKIITLNSWKEGIGIGSRLISEVKQVAVLAGCKRLCLVTTNDNTRALNFYQKRGFVLAGIWINAMEYARRLKPSIPMSGCDGIPIRDEIEMELFV